MDDNAKSKCSELYWRVLYRINSLNHTELGDSDCLCYSDSSVNPTQPTKTKREIYHLSSIFKG